MAPGPPDFPEKISGNRAAKVYFYERSRERQTMLPQQWLLCLWPGLARLWTRGEWSSLFLAIGFALLLNIAIVSTLIWPELLGAGFPGVIWPVLLGVWVVSAFVSHHFLATPAKKAVEGPAVASPVPDTLFIQAQREYLKGHWSDAEQMLTKRLHFRPRDVEARLLLATIWRRQQKSAEAARELDLLQGFDEAAGWRFEIERERELLHRESQEVGEDDAVGEEMLGAEDRQTATSGLSDEQEPGRELTEARLETPVEKIPARPQSDSPAVPTIRSPGKRAA